jgi:hypothetical protein
VTTSERDHNPAVKADLAWLSRRTMLHSLAGMALSGCGGGGEGGTVQAAAADAGSDGEALRRALAVTSSAAFAHPGLLHTQADLERMQRNLGNLPWKGSWDILTITNGSGSGRASLTRTPGPALPIIYRGYDGVNAENYSRLFNDIAAAYACALRWRLSGDTRYADKAVVIMNMWSSTLTAISGTSDKYLASGIYGYEFANAGELMRDYPGWAAADFQRFQGMMRNIFYPMCHDFLVNHNGYTGVKVAHYYANWDLCNTAAVMAIGVLCDERALFDEAVDYYKNGAGSGAIAQAVYYVHPGHMGQWQESGRDQGHCVLGVALCGALCEMAWNQGVDLYGWDNNRFLMGAEYIAKSNLKDSSGSYNVVPYVRHANEIVKGAAAQTVLSVSGIGNVRPCWALVYNHYVRRRGLAAPYTEQFAALVAPEGGGGNYGTTSGGYDQLGYGTLTHTQEASAAGTGASGLTAYVTGGSIVLSWWGCAGALGYSVQRSANAAGPFAQIASVTGAALTFTDTPPSDGQWFYRIVASSAAGDLAPSNTASALCGTFLHTRLTLEQGTGVALPDASGNGHDATVSGSASWVAGRRSGTSVLALGGGYVQLPNNLLDDVGDFSVAIWAKCASIGANAKLFDFGSGVSRYLSFTPKDSTGFAKFAFTVTAVDGELVIPTTQAFPLGRWVHVAIAVQGRTATLYWDGVAVGSSSDFFQAPFRLGPTGQNWLGRAQDSRYPNIVGSLDDLRIYRGGLNPAQVQALATDQPISVNASAGLRFVVQGATLNRATQRYVGGVTLVNETAAALSGVYQLAAAGLASSVSLVDAGGQLPGTTTPFVAVNLALNPGASVTVPLSFLNPSRLAIAYTPSLYRSL